MQSQKNRRARRRINSALSSLSKVAQVLILVYVWVVLFSITLRCAFNSIPPRSSVHWIGRLRRPRRLERHLFVVLLFLPLILFEPRQYLLWSVAWGGVASVFVIVLSSLRLLSKVRA